ncbi:MAG: ATP-binding protein [Lachnospiraceae bacterium]|nr:ATP-binding protein [Lachnospiraceae bacterium]
MARMVGIGVQDFEEMIKKDHFYVDKTSFIKEWWERKDVVTLITRPRRFGKTLTMSMVDRFFSLRYEGKGDIFEGLDIWKDEQYRALQGSYPVISMTFANIKEVNYPNTRYRINQLIKEVYKQYDFLLEGDTLTEEEKKNYRMVTESMLEVVAASAITKLSELLHRYYKKKVIILLDEFDTPLLEAYTGGYDKELSAFLRSMFISIFKANPDLERGIMTGVTGISRDSVLSDLNNMKVVTTTSEEYAAVFGFTEEEVFAGMDAQGLGERKEEVKEWYGGFHFGRQKDMYNPWSVLNYMDTRDVKTFWANSGVNSLIGRLLRQGSREVKESLECLLRGEHLFLPIEEQMVYAQLDESEYAVWSFLLANGYLTVADHGMYGTQHGNMGKDHHGGKTGENRSSKDKKSRSGKKGKHQTEKAAAAGNAIHKEIAAYEEVQLGYELAFPNREVSVMFRDMVQGWFLKKASDFNDFIKALLSNDADAMNKYMNRISTELFDVFDTEVRPSGKEEPERFYHAFVLGLMVGLADRYLITSNRESGIGRYDIMLEPKNDALDAYVIGFILFNKNRDMTMEDTVAAAHKQMEEKQYDDMLAAKGIRAERMKKYGFAFQGKEVLIG